MATQTALDYFEAWLEPEPERVDRPEEPRPDEDKDGDRDTAPLRRAA